MTVRSAVKRHRRRLVETNIPELEYPWWISETVAEVTGFAVLAGMILFARCRG